MPIAYVETENGMQPVYSESWCAFRDDSGQWFRCKQGDLRATWQLCVKNSAVDKNIGIDFVDSIPIAKALTDKEREMIETYNRKNFMPYSHRQSVRREPIE